MNLSYLDAMKIYKLGIIGSICLMANVLFSCQEKLLEELTIYSNDFSSMDLKGIESDEGVYPYNDEHVLGLFNNQGFTLTLDNLPNHNMVRITMDLYIHNYWNGNSLDIDGPDIWNMWVDNSQIINTTFSNTPCTSTYCQHQSYPENIIRTFTPKTDAAETNLPGLFEQRNNLGWTTLYKIHKIIPHNQKTLSIRCYDILQQENAPIPKQDESWSVGKIEVSVLNVK